MIFLPSGNSTSSTCGLISVHFMFWRAPIWISLSKWPMLQTIAMFFIARIWSSGDDVGIAGGGDEDVGALHRFLHRHDLIAFHRRLKRADRIDLGDEDPGAAVAERSGRALADVAEAGDGRDLAGEHDVGAAADGVDQALLAAVEIVELRLGDAVVDVDRREGKLALLG